MRERAYRAVDSHAPSSSTAARALIALALICSSLAYETEANAHTLPISDLPEACLGGLNQDSWPIDVVVSSYPGNQMTVTAPGRTQSGCTGYSWIKLVSPPTNRILWPDFGVNVNSSAWNCSHTALTWGMYAKAPGASSWVFINGGANIMGKLVAGKCTYEHHNFFDPSTHGPGSPPFAALPATGSEFRMAIKAWQHDDLPLHPNIQCGGLPECHQPVSLLISNSLTVSGVFVNQDWNTPAPPDWHSGFTKGTCSPGWTQSGLSNNTSPSAWAHAVLCRYAGILALAGEHTATLVAPGDQRRAARSVNGNPDWAPGFWKLECGFHEYVSGSSAEPGSVNRFRGIMCASAGAPGLSSASCSVRVFDNGDGDGANDNPDWDFGYYKGECATNEYLAGVSVATGTYRPHSLLCCPR
jgi:hypothetical protein